VRTVAYAKQTFTDDNDPRTGVHLDIDWNDIAFSAYERDRISCLMAEILNRDFIPESILFARSPDYGHPDGKLFEQFIKGLDAKFEIRPSPPSAIRGELGRFDILKSATATRFVPAYPDAQVPYLLRKVLHPWQDSALTHAAVAPTALAAAVSRGSVV